MLENPVRDTRRWSFSGSATTLPDPRRRDILSLAIGCYNLIVSIIYYHHLLSITDHSMAVVLLWFAVVCFCVKSFGDISPYVFLYYFSSVLVAEWPPFEK